LVKRYLDISIVLYLGVVLNIVQVNWVSYPREVRGGHALTFYSNM
jgi:hypothetical protein